MKFFTQIEQSILKSVYSHKKTLNNQSNTEEEEESTAVFLPAGRQIAQCHIPLFTTRSSTDLAWLHLSYTYAWRC